MDLFLPGCGDAGELVIRDGDHFPDIDDFWNGWGTAWKIKKLKEGKACCKWHRHIENIDILGQGIAYSLKKTNLPEGDHPSASSTHGRRILPIRSVNNDPLQA